MKKYSYFAYGSNMNPEQMKNRVGNLIDTPKPAKLPGYKLTFNKYSVNRSKEYDAKMSFAPGTTRVGAANIVPTGNKNDVVEGVIYSLDEKQLSKLDMDEGYTLRNGDINVSPNGYKRQVITLSDGTIAQTYIASISANDADMNLLPTKDYLENFLKVRDLLSPEYYQQLLQIKYLDEASPAEASQNETITISKQRPSFFYQQKQEHALIENLNTLDKRNGHFF